MSPHHLVAPSYVAPTSSFFITGARAWSPGIVERRPGYSCFHLRSDGSTFPRRNRHQTAVRAPPTNRQHSNSPEFMNYVSSTWIEGSTWRPSCWSVYMQSVRTNNDVEGWHHDLHIRAQGKSQLLMYHLIDLFHKEARLTSLSVRIASEKKLRRVQRHRYSQIQATVFSLWGQYENGDKTPGSVLVYEFIRE